MARITLVRQAPRTSTNLSHRNSSSEGEAAKVLLEAQGYFAKKTGNGQYSSACPFHEGPGVPSRGKTANFYVSVETGVFYCHSASCGERGNLYLLERHFGIVHEEGEDHATFRSRDAELKEFERALTKELRKPFYDEGITDQTIERFRIGFQAAHTETKVVDDEEKTVRIGNRYIIPYLENGRPRYFRYYSPQGDPKWKYTWEEGARATLFNVQDSVGGSVFDGVKMREGVVAIAESEKKAMLLWQLGIPSVGVPGAGQWRPEFQAAFSHAREIYVVYDNDNPAFHIYDKPEEGKACQRCHNLGMDRCQGHNPGQDAARARVMDLGWRAKNVLLPLPDNRTRKTDVNEFFMRDGNTVEHLRELMFGSSGTGLKVASLADLQASPPEEGSFLVDQGILPESGRLLVAGKGKAGKSLLVNNLALSLASGIPFLGRFNVNSGDSMRPGVRTLLLDRELSRRSLYDRMNTLIEGRPGYRAGLENLLIDHDHLIRLEQKNSADLLKKLVDNNGARVVIFDCAYKFIPDIESSQSLMKAFAVLDDLIESTGVAVVLVHHMKKGGNLNQSGGDQADSDSVAGSFLWTGWPNATLLLNFMNRSVEDPFNTVATFTAFRDAAPPEPLALYRDRSSINYTSVQDFTYPSGRDDAPKAKFTKPSTELLQNLLLELAPITEEEFLHAACAHFGATLNTIRPFFVDAMSSGHFERTSGKYPVIRFAGDAEIESWEAEHHLPEKPAVEASLDSMLDLGGVW